MWLISMLELKLIHVFERGYRCLGAIDGVAYVVPCQFFKVIETHLEIGNWYMKLKDSRLLSE